MVRICELLVTMDKEVHKGKGYAMGASKKERTIEHTLQGTKPAPKTEMQANVFIDDSIWATSNSQDMQQMIRNHERFCSFHKVNLNLDKCDYFSMNTNKETQATAHNGKSRHATRPGAQVQWTPRVKRENVEQPSGGTKYERSEGVGALLRNKCDGEEGHATIKYLGVWFDTKEKWPTQIKAMKAAHEELMTYLRETKLTREIAIYAINCKVIPAIAYGAQVAYVPRTTLKRWDAAHRKIVAKAGKLPRTAIPTQLYHIRKDVGGLGLRSIEDVIDENRIKLDYQARNDTFLQKYVSDQAKIVRASWDRYNSGYAKREKTTVCGMVHESMKRLNMTLVQTMESFQDAADEDLAVMLNRRKTDTVKRIYTDGSTHALMNRAGWGVAMYEEEDEDAEVEAWGRLSGQQDNFRAETMALLQALLQMHPQQHANIYIDNYAVVQRWKRNEWDNPRARSKGKARALWNRIDIIKREMRTRGGLATVQWVHSHVDKDDGGDSREGHEARQRRGEEKKKKRKGMTWAEKQQAKEEGKVPTCACGEPGGKHDAAHMHHKGNDAADELAEKGAFSDRPPATENNSKKGEEQYTLYRGAEYVAGDVGAAIKEAAQENRIEEMKKGTSSRGKDWATAYEEADATMRAHVIRETKGLERFRIRAMTDSLPTYKNEAAKVKAGNEYERLYGDKLKGGLCRCCDDNKIETANHMWCECKGGEEARESVMEKIRAVWTAYKVGHHWLMIDYLTHDTERWRKWWGWIGLVPKSATKYAMQQRTGTHRAMVAAMKETTALLAKYASDKWTDRTDRSRQWEQEVGICEKKKQPRPTDSPSREARRKRGKGRPKKPRHLLAAAYKQRLENTEVLAALVREHGQDEGKKKFKAIKARQREQTKAATLGILDALDAQMAPMQPQERGQQFKQEIKPHKRGRKSAQQVEVTEDVIMRRADKRAANQCMIDGCDEQATHTAMGCGNELRCKAHQRWSCLGVIQPCGCEQGEEADVIAWSKRRRKKERLKDTYAEPQVQTDREHKLTAGKCMMDGCERNATRTAMKCRTEPRCEAHANHSCLGVHQPCDCERTDSRRTVRIGSKGKQRKRKPHKPRDKSATHDMTVKNRAIEIDYDDEIMVEGEKGQQWQVKHMMWEQRGGFRWPSSASLVPLRPDVRNGKEVNTRHKEISMHSTAWTVVRRKRKESGGATPYTLKGRYDTHEKQRKEDMALRGNRYEILGESGAEQRVIEAQVGRGTGGPTTVGPSEEGKVECRNAPGQVTKEAEREWIEWEEEWRAAEDPREVSEESRGSKEPQTCESKGEESITRQESSCQATARVRESESDPARRLAQGERVSKTAEGAMQRMMPSVWKGTLQGPWWVEVWDYELRVEADGSRCTQIVRVEGVMRECNDAKVIVDETGYTPRVAITDEETRCTGEMNVMETEITGVVTQEGEVGEGKFELRREESIQQDAVEREEEREGGEAEETELTPSKAQERGEQQGSSPGDRRKQSAITLCIALFSMPGLAATYDKIVDHLMWHIGNMSAYEQRTRCEVQMRIACDRDAREDMQSRLAHVARDTRNKVKIYEWEALLPTWYPKQLMQEQLARQNKTLACLTRYMLSTVDKQVETSYIFGDANDLVTPEGVAILMEKGPLSVCVDEVLQAKSTKKSSQCYYLGGAAYIREDRVDAFNAAIAAATIEMIAATTREGTATSGLRAKQQGNNCAMQYKQAHQAIKEWAGEQGFDKKRVIEFLDQAVLQIAMKQTPGDVREVIVQYKQQRGGNPEHWIDKEDVILLRGARITKESDRGKRSKRSEYQARSRRRQRQDEHTQEVAPVTKRQYVSRQGNDRTCLMHAVKNVIGGECRESEEEQFRMHSGGDTGDWGTDTLVRVMADSPTYEVHSLSSEVTARLHENMHAIEQRVVGLVMHTGEGESQHWDALRVEGEGQWTYVDSLRGGHAEYKTRQQAANTIIDRVSEQHRVIAICLKGVNPMRDIRLSRRRSRSAVGEAGEEDEGAFKTHRSHEGDTEAQKDGKLDGEVKAQGGGVRGGREEQTQRESWKGKGGEETS